MRDRLTARFVSILLLAILSLAVYESGKRGLADAIAYGPRHAIERLHSESLLSDEIALNVLQTQFLKAHYTDPDNPSLLEDMGLFYAHREKSGQSLDPLRQAALLGSLKLLRRALVLRPQLDRGYLNIAVLKFRLGEIDQEFVMSLQRALDRAPWEPAVVLQVVELSLANWEHLSPELREKIRQTIRVHAQWHRVDQKSRLVELIAWYGRADLECLLDVVPTACQSSGR